MTVGSNPFGPYNVYFAHADYNPNEPGYPSLLNDFAKISTTPDAFLLFYDVVFGLLAWAAFEYVVSET